MNRRYIVTGAHGHLGSTLIRMLEQTGDEIYGLILPTEQETDHGNVRYIRGDLRNPASMRPLFACAGDRELYVIHTAGIIDISKDGSPLIYDVNVGGTENVLKLCRENRVRRLVYTSSVHAIAEPEANAVIGESDRFSADSVVGVYAKTKAEATAAVLRAGREGLDVVVVHPSGIIGPNDNSGNHLVQMITDYMRGALPACVRGGYDFVDVRDVAKGCLLALEKGRSGECYILSNRHYEIREVLGMVRSVTGQRRIPTLPMWMAKMAAPTIQWVAKLRKIRPLYTGYSLYTLTSNDRFSHDKATRELGYSPRDLRETVRDTVRWYQGKQAQGAAAV